MKGLRRTAGGTWRLLVHTKTKSHHIAPNKDIGYGASGGYDRCREWLGAAAQYGDYVELPDAEFDELVVGQWIHLEQMDTGLWWCDFAGVTLHVKVDRDGKPKLVRVNMPGTYDGPVDGCEYVLDDEPYPLEVKP